LLLPIEDQGDTTVNKLPFVLMTLLSLASSVNCEDSTPDIKLDKLPSVAWERVFGEGDLQYENETLKLFAKPEELFLVGSATKFAHSTLKQEGIWGWKIDGAGHKKTEITLKHLKMGKSVIDLKSVKSIVVCPDETIMLLSKSYFGEALLVKMNFKGEILFSIKLDTDKKPTKILETTDDAYLLIGEEKGFPLVIKVDTMGNELWAKTYTRHKYGRFIDAIADTNGGFILVENSGASNESMTDACDVFVSKYTASGESVNERYILGRYGNVCIGQNTLVLLYDKSHTTAHDYWVQAFDKDLSPLWDQNVTSNTFGFYQYKIAALPDGGYIIAGSTEATGKTSLTYLDYKGVIKWRYSSNPQSVFATDIACSTSGCYLVQSITTLRARETEIRKIKVTKFQPQ
jgi:hypothetical protein